MGCVYLTSLYWYCFNVLVDPAVYAHTIAYCSSSITTLLILLGGVEVVSVAITGYLSGECHNRWLS